MTFKKISNPNTLYVFELIRIGFLAVTFYRYLHTFDLKSRYMSLWQNSRRSFSERRRRSGDGRKKDIFEERSAANQEEYFRRETARQLKEIRERGVKRKAEKETEAESDKKRKGAHIEGEEAEASAATSDA